MRDDELNLAWAAGLFEGEGCITVGGRYRAPRLTLSMTDQDIVERFASIIGRGTIRPLDKAKEQAHYQQQWRWACHTEGDILAVMSLLLPWLGDRRRSRWNEAFAEWQANLAARSEYDCLHCGGAFRPCPNQTGRQRYCSRRCQRRGHARHGALDAPRAAPTRAPATGSSHA